MEYEEKSFFVDITTLIVIGVVLAVVVIFGLLPQSFWVGLSMNLFK